MKKPEDRWAPKCVKKGCNAPVVAQGEMTGSGNIHVWLCEWHYARFQEGEGFYLDERQH